ncbi:tRNA threonylcarbamoyladenosine dehydratase [Aerococcaceae bacterium DSM 111020]|nr:tRNA threonylcarbamoyladenosine dehydratase [Aerococcaceae bacterium DSM 111020]
MVYDITTERFSRLTLLMGEEGLNKLAHATVMVLGIGGVGAKCAETLARGGIGTLILVDKDTVELSNINRQTVAYDSTIGRIKVEVMEEIIKDINPDCEVHTKQVFLNRDNIEEVFSTLPHPDYVIDCIDTVTAKLSVYEWCAAQDLPLLSSMGAANKFDPSLLTFEQIEQTVNCPLSKVIRRECRRKGIHHLEVLYSTELPVKLDHGGSSIKSETLGTMSYMPPMMGMMLASKAIRRLAGLENYQNKLTLNKDDTID